MSRIRGIIATLEGYANATASSFWRVIVSVWRLVSDRMMRPAILYVLALLLGFGSFIIYFLHGGGTPTTVELGLQLGSLGVVFYMSLRQAGTRARR